MCIYIPLNTVILIIGTPQNGAPNFGKPSLRGPSKVITILGLALRSPWPVGPLQALHLQD